MAASVQLYEETCTAYIRVFGPDHPDTLARRANLANAYYRVGWFSDAVNRRRSSRILSSDRAGLSHSTTR